MNQLQYRIGAPLILAVLLLVLSVPVHSWGPHTEITQAALDILDADDPIVLHLGPYMRRLPSYAWMPDYRSKLRLQDDGVYYYPDDFLLFPQVPYHIGHTCPLVEEAFEPYFHRALQALRSETPVNAARWVGSLLHFTEDPGAPPHALRTGGALHKPMENWLDKTKINIDGYRPKLLGRTDEEALAGYLARMQELIAYSRQRAERIIPLMTEENRPIVEPIILECAVESSRATADVLYTLGRLDLRPAEGSAGIRGIIRSKVDMGLDTRPAKIILEGTNYSTVTDSSGFYQLLNLSPGKYGGLVMLPTCAHARFSVVLQPGEIRTLNVMLFPGKQEGNLLRNGDLSLKWMRPDVPDCWLKTAETWEGELIPVKGGSPHILRVHWKETAEGSAVPRWYSSLSKPGTETDETLMTSGESQRTFTAPEDAVAARVIIRTPEMLTDVFEAISLTPVKGK